MVPAKVLILPALRAFYNIGTEELLTELPNRVILMVELFFKG
jgi:hypothetical protein